MDRDVENSEVLKVSPRISRSDRRVILNQRDLELFRFLLDMKFASLIQLHAKFFSTKMNGQKAGSAAWASDRLKALERNGFLIAKSGYGSRENQYFVSPKGRLYLGSLDVSQSHLPAIKAIDIRTFEHDKHVVNARIALEKAGRATHWDSERRLKAELSPTFNLRDQFLPDGIYRNSLGHSIAFELEIAVKEKRRYKEKIEKYVESFSKSSTGSHPLRGALFVATSDLVYNRLKDSVSKYPKHFLIEKYGSLVSQNSDCLDHLVSP